MWPGGSGTGSAAIQQKEPLEEDKEERWEGSPGRLEGCESCLEGSPGRLEEYESCLEHRDMEEQRQGSLHSSKELVDGEVVGAVVVVGG